MNGRVVFFEGFLCLLIARLLTCTNVAAGSTDVIVRRKTPLHARTRDAIYANRRSLARIIRLSNLVLSIRQFKVLVLFSVVDFLNNCALTNRSPLSINHICFPVGHRCVLFLPDIPTAASIFDSVNHHQTLANQTLPHRVVFVCLVQKWSTALSRVLQTDLIGLLARS